MQSLGRLLDKPPLRCCSGPSLNQFAGPNEMASVEPDSSSCCAVCMEVLMDPVSLPCGHTLDQKCLQQVIASTTCGKACCPTCRDPVPEPYPRINVTIRDMVERFYPQQVSPLFEPYRPSSNPAAHPPQQQAKTRLSAVSCMT